MSDELDTRNRDLGHRLLAALDPGAIAASVALPQQVGRYRVRELLGQGGMGVVLRAEHEGQSVALKLLREGDAATPDQRRRFLREARALQALEHPNVVAVQEVGEHEGAPFLAIDFVPGGSLRQLLDRMGPLDERWVAEIGAQLADGLALAHRRGLLHRDLKPGNVLLTEAGVPVLCDFGLAKDLRRQKVTEELSRSGAVLGTPGFLAPEQAEATRDLGPAVDLYGLGATLYTLLSGRPPFDGRGSLEVLLATAKAQPTRLRDARPEIDPRLAAIVERCLEKEAASRWPTSESLARALRHYLAEAPTRSTSLASPALAVLSVVLALLGLGLLTLVWRTPPERALDPVATDAPPALDPDPTGPVARGTALLERGEAEQAIPELSRAIELDPLNADALGKRGLAYYELSRFPAALADLDRALRLDPKAGALYLLRGRTKRELGRVAEAIEDFDRALAHDEPTADTLTERGAAKMHLSDYEGALADLGRALLLDPTHPGASYAHGMSFVELGRFEGALVDFERLIRLEPTSGHAYLGRGSAKSGLGRYAEAIKDFDRALALGPPLADHYAMRGLAKSQLGNHTEALSDLDRALEGDLSPRTRAVVTQAREAAAAHLGR